jgi:hypothetical protein
MPHCIALVPSALPSLLWSRCQRPTLRGERLCRRHRTAIDGAVMGFVDTEDYRHAQTLFRQQESNPARRKPPSKQQAPWQPREPNHVHGSRSSKKGFSIKKSVKKLRLSRQALEDFFSR